jgi:outer membrane protein assembly factor BamC
MTYKLQIVGLIVGSLLAACSSLEERELASGSFQYVKEQPGQKIQIPEEVDSPKFSDTFKLPAISEDAPKNVVGKELSILSPALVLPVVAGSHVEEGSKSAKVWFDQVDDSEPLDSTIWNSLIRFLEKEGIGIEQFDRDNQRLITEWIVKDESAEKSWYSWSASERKVGQRFEFFLELKPHGRTAALSADLIEYKEQLTADSAEITKARDHRRNEVDILNQVVKNYEFEVKVADVKRYRQIRQGLAMDLGFDSDGEPAFVVDAGYDITWPRLLLVLRKLGFDVKDYDKSNGLLFVKYNGPDDSWWTNIWSSDKDKMQLDTKEYRLKVATAGDKTSITMLDEESNPFEVNKLTDLYPTFSKTMSADDLDI